MTPALQGFHTICTLRRRPRSPDFSLGRFSTVRARNRRLDARLTALALFARFILGVLIVLFFQCMAALFNLAYRRGEGIRWGLVSYTTVMFLFATVYTAMNLNMQSTSFIDNRKFLGLGGSSLGPLGYQAFARSELFNLTPNLMFLLNCWLADGLLVGHLFNAAFARPAVLRSLLLQLYRCYVIYAMKSWAVIVLPCFLYLSCVGAHFTLHKPPATL